MQCSWRSRSCLAGYGTGCGACRGAKGAGNNGAARQSQSSAAEDRLTNPSGDNAVGYAQEVLDLDPAPGPQRILRDVVSRYGVMAGAVLDRVEAVKQQELAKANTFRTLGEQVAERHGLSDERLTEWISASRP